MNQKSGRILAVAFDLDGLMVNTEDIYDDVLGKVLGKRGREFNLELKLKLMGLTAQDAFAVLKDHCGLDEPVEILGLEVKSTFVNEVQHRAKAMEGLAELLAFIDHTGLRRCVATSSPRQLAEATLQSVGLTGFEFVLTGDDVEQGKPNPEIYLKAAAQFGVDPKNMLALEDSLNGSLAAVRSGALTVVIPGEHSLGQDFSHAAEVLSSLADSELRRILAE